MLNGICANCISVKICVEITCVTGLVFDLKYIANEFVKTLHVK